MSKKPFISRRAHRVHREMKNIKRNHLQWGYNLQASRQTEFKITPEARREIVMIIDERIREVHVTKEDFSRREEHLVYLPRIIG